MGEFQADRRTMLGAGAVLLGAGAIAPPARAQGSSADAWRPALEQADSWMDKPGTRHRIAFDTTNAKSASAGLMFANNYIHSSMDGYGLTPGQLGVIVIMRQMATPFAFNDRMWGKYGRTFAAMLSLEGEDAIRSVRENPLLTAAPGAPPPKGLEWLNDRSIASLHALGVRIAVCGLATAEIAVKLSGRGKDFARIRAELADNLVPGAVMMPSGIAAVGHAQEHGYAFAYVGSGPKSG